MALVQFHRRGVEKAKEVAAIMDGAEWEQGFVDYHCPQATRILDFAHPAEHMSVIGNVEYGENTPESQVWLKEQSHRLKHNGPDQWLLDLQEIKQPHPASEEIAKNLAYLTKRRDQMRYLSSRKPVGPSAVVR